jgi:NADPH:quinone reductase-like Zn-dependent oxidoreductase
MGADVVLQSGTPGFGEALKQHCSELGATLLLDAVGGEQTALLLDAAPHGSLLISYARLAGTPMRIDPAALIQEGKILRGFQLGQWLDTQSLWTKLKLLRQVGKALPDMLSSPVRQTMPLEQVEQAIALYRENMSAGKVLLRLSEPTPPTPKTVQS